MPIRDAIVVSVGMQKGGVAKTTNALHLAAALAERGRRVLLWDVDENYGATKVFGIADQDLWTTMDVVTGSCSIEDAIVHGDEENAEFHLPIGLDFIPSSRALQSFERGGKPGSPTNSGDCLRRHIEKLRCLNLYDYILVDNGPHASAATRSAYLISDYYILSLIPEKQAIASLPDALRDIVNARRRDRNPDLHLLGLILSCMDRRLALGKKYEEAIARGFMDSRGNPVKFETTISIAAAIDQAYQQNRLLLDTEPSHRVSKQYRELAREVEERIRSHRMGKKERGVASMEMIEPRIQEEMAANG